MTEDDFRRLALSLADAEESEHMNHPDFRVRGKIFASLRSPSEGWGMVKLTPEQQEMFMRLAPDAFQPASGSWGLKGSTNVMLKKAKKGITREALLVAWRNITSR
jgi:YjbR